MIPRRIIHENSVFKDDGIIVLNPNSLITGGRIDHGHHFGVANLALTETVAMDKAIDVALGLVDTEETLVMVTSDHAHTFKMAGYSARGNPILGKLKKNIPNLKGCSSVSILEWSLPSPFLKTQEEKSIFRFIAPWLLCSAPTHQLEACGYYRETSRPPPRVSLPDNVDSISW